MARIGYARVSTSDQDLHSQIDRLKEQGCSIVRSEKVSGGSREGREELATIIDFLRQGDELVVTRLDRLGRDTRDVLNIVHECHQRNAYLTILQPPVSTKGEMGRIILTVLGMVAEMERSFIRERQREGISRAKARGVYKGGRRTVDHDEASRMQLEGQSVSSIARALKCSRQHIYRILNNETNR